MNTSANDTKNTIEKLLLAVFTSMATCLSVLVALVGNETFAVSGRHIILYTIAGTITFHLIVFFILMLKVVKKGSIPPDESTTTDEKSDITKEEESK
jgi:hypothetical protein